MNKSLLITQFLLFNILFGDVYSDRFLVYIANSITDIKIYKSTGRTNLDELNDEMDKIGAISISQWLPNARPTDRDGDIYLNRYFVIYLASINTDIYDLAKRAIQLDCIQSSETMPVIKPTYIPNDPLWNVQYGLPLIQADLAYDLWDIDGGEIPGQMDNGEIVVAVVDDALDWDHPDLVDNLWQNLGEDADGDGVVIVQSGSTWIFDPDDVDGIDNDEDGYEDNFIGWDVQSNDNDPTHPDPNYSHGTNVAGCVSASTNNNTNIASVGWSVKIMAFRCSNNPDYITTGWAGILTAAQMGANVINCSWGSFGGGNQSVINAAYNNYGSIIVASSGNGGDDGNTNFDFHAPSGLDNVISVSAIGPNDNFSCWATAGETVDLCAPGENIRTTSVGGGTVNVWGTSFSSPMTAGAVALLWSKYPSAPKEWIEEIIISSTDEFSDMYGSCQGNSLEGMLGSGRLNIYNAILYADSLLSPSLLIEEINYLNDSDGDGVFNPGEQVKVKLVIGNEEGVADAENVVATISSEDDRIAILDNTITFENTIGSGESSFPLLDHFLVYTFEDVELGDVPCIVHIQAGVTEPYYEIDIEIDLNISLNQYGFPIDGMVIESSPLIADVDGNSIGEIYFGSDNGSLYGYTIAGYPQYGFPFSTGDNIRSSPAVGDVDADGNNEIVFGSYDGKLYILSTNGAQELAYTQSGYIVGSPALVDLDGDSDLEIVFTTQNGNSGMVYAIHHDGNDMDGFPVDLDEKMLVGAAVGDLEGDGSNDIVVCTWDDHVYAIDNTGTIKEGFPFTSTNRFNAPPTLVDLDGDGDLEIIAGNDSGLLHVLHHDGTEMTSYDVGDDIRGGISVADLNDDGSYELLFAGYDDMIHVWNPMDGVELDGWPVDMDYNSLTEPVTADLDNDGDLEVVAAMKSGMVYIFHHDATLFNGFPTNLSGNIESSPAIGDLDNDGDYEIAFGTTSGLQVFDIKTDKGNRHSWKLHRGNLERSGLYDITLTAIDPKNDIIPDKFYVSPNYPNPFNPVTTIKYGLNTSGDVIMYLFDIRGAMVQTLVNEHHSAGFYELTFDGSKLASGVYFYSTIANGIVKTRKLVLLK